MNVTFDGPNKLIILGSGTVSVALPDLYTAWKDWVRLGTNSKWPPFFSTVGGEDIDAAAGTKVPLYLFLMNGARIRPQEADHTVTFSGGTLVVEGGGDPFANTLGNYRVRIRYAQPVQAIGYDMGGGGGGGGPVTIDFNQVAEAVWQRVLSGAQTPGSAAAMLQETAVRIAAGG